MVRALLALPLALFPLLAGAVGLREAVRERSPRTLTLEALLRAPPEETRWVRLEGCVLDPEHGRIVKGSRSTRVYVPLRAAGQEALPARAVLVTKDARLSGIVREFEDGPGDRTRAWLRTKHAAWLEPRTIEGLAEEGDDTTRGILGAGNARVLTVDHDGEPRPLLSLVLFLLGLFFVVGIARDAVKARRRGGEGAVESPRRRRGEGA